MANVQSIIKLIDNSDVVLAKAWTEIYIDGHMIKINRSTIFVSDNDKGYFVSLPIDSFKNESGKTIYLDFITLDEKLKLAVIKSIEDAFEKKQQIAKNIKDGSLETPEKQQSEDDDTPWEIDLD